MARPDDAEDATRVRRKIDHTTDPSEFSNDIEIPRGETEKRPLLARAIERIQKTADGFRSTITSGFEALGRRTQKEGVQPPEPLDPEGLLNQVEEAQDMLGTIIEEINDGAHADVEIARLKAAQAQRELEEGYAQNVEGPVKRFISWLTSGEGPAATRGQDQQEQETQTDDEGAGVARVDRAQTQGAPLSRLGELAKRVFTQKAETDEYSDEDAMRLVADAYNRITTSESDLREEYRRMDGRLRSLRERAGASETEDQRQAVDTLLLSLDGRWRGLSIVEYLNAKTALQEDIGNKRSGAYQRFEEKIKAIEDNFHTFLAGIDEKMSPIDGGFEAGDQEAKERLLTEADIRVEAELDAMQKKVDPLMARIDSALVSSTDLSPEQRKNLNNIKTSLNAEHQQFHEGVNYVHGRLQYAIENKTTTLTEAESVFNKYIQSNVDQLNGRLALFEGRLDSILAEAEATESGVPPPPEEPKAPPPPAAEVSAAPKPETLSDAERARLEQGVKDADFLVGAFETADDRYTLAQTELNRLSDPTLKSNIKHDLDLNLDRLIGMRNAVRNARDVLNDELNGRKKGGDTTRALSVVNEHNAPGSDFYTRRANFYRAVSALEDALSAQEAAAAPSPEVSAVVGSGVESGAGSTAEAAADAPPTPEAPSLPPDVQKKLDAARFVLKHATDTDDAYLKRIKDSRGSANKLSEDEGRAIQNFQIACSGIRDALNNAEAILKGDTFHGDRQKLNDRIGDAYASLEKLKTVADLASDLADAAYLLEQNLPSTIEPVLAAARAKVEQDAREQLREAITDATDKAVRGYNDLIRRIPREFDNLAVLDKDAPPGITVVQALSEIHDQITYAQGEVAKGDLLGAQATLKVVNEGWIQPLNAVIDSEIAVAQKVRAEAAATTVPPTETSAPAEAVRGASGGTEVPAGLDEFATAPGTGTDTELPLNSIDSLKKSAKELVNDKLNILASNLGTLIRNSLTDEQRDWASEQYGKLGVKADKIRTAAEALLTNDELRGKVELGDDATREAFINTLKTALDTLIAEFPMTQESVAAAMAAEAATPVPGAGAGRPSSAEIQTPGAPSGAGETGKPSTAELIENQKDAAQEFVESELREPLRKVFTPLYAERSLTDDERKWILNKYNATFTRSGELLTQHATDLAAAKSPAQQGAAFSKVTLEGPRLVREFPKTKEELRAAMVAEAAGAAAAAEAPEVPSAPGAAAASPEAAAAPAPDTSGVESTLRTYEREQTELRAAFDEKIRANPERYTNFTPRLDAVDARFKKALTDLTQDLAKAKTADETALIEKQLRGLYDNYLDDYDFLAGQMDVYSEELHAKIEQQSKLADLTDLVAKLQQEIADLKAAQASGGAPATPGVGGPGTPGGPSGPGGGPTPPPVGGGPAGPGGPTSPEPGAPEDPEKAQAEAIKTELETTLIPEIQTALAGREYLHDVQVFLPIKLPENPGAINGIKLLLEGHIDSVNGAPAKIDQRIAAGTILEARQFAEDAKVHAEAIIKFLREPLSSESEQRAVQALQQRFIRTAAGYQRNIETANNDLFPRTRDLMHPMGIDTAPLRELFERTGDTFNYIEDNLRAIPPDLSVIADAYRNFQTEVDEVAQEVARLQQEVADGTLGARAQRAADAARGAVAGAGRAVRDAGPRAARAVGRADREWGRRIERGLDRSGRADSFEDRARRFFHGLGERFRSNLADRLGLGFNSAIIRFHERGVEDIALRTDALREEINNPEDGLVVLIAKSRRILDPSNPDELPPGEIATERREYNRLVRELGARQRDLDRDLGTLERRRAAAQPYFDARQNIATDAKLRLEQYTGERAARYDAARKRSGQIRGELSAAESDRDQLSAEIQTVRLSLHTERRALRAGLRRQITRMESQLRSMNREIGPQRRVLATVNNDIASLAPHVTYWRDQVLPEFTRFSREPVPVNHGNFGPREVPGLDTTRHSTRPAPTTPDSFTGAPIAGGGGGGGTPEAPAPAAAGGEQGRTGVEAGDENIRISPRDIAEALFRKWGSQIGVASADGMATEMQNFITAPQRFATGLDQKFELSQLRDFITEFNQHLNAAHFNKVDLRTLRTLTRDLRSRAGAENRAA